MFVFIVQISTDPIAKVWSLKLVEFCILNAVWMFALRNSAMFTYQHLYSHRCLFHALLFANKEVINLHFNSWLQLPNMYKCRNAVLLLMANLPPLVTLFFASLSRPFCSSLIFHAVCQTNTIHLATRLIFARARLYSHLNTVCHQTAVRFICW